MDQSSALAQLAWLTASLSATAAADAFQLQTVREALARSLLAPDADPAESLSGLQITPSRPPSATEIESLAQIVQNAADAAIPPRPPRVVPRSLPAPLLTNPALMPAATIGMRGQVLGPFADQLGTLRWFDIIPSVQQTTVTRAPGTAPLLSLPLAADPNPTATTLQVQAGSLWIDAQQLDPAAPAGSYAGIAIGGGTLILSAPATEAAGTVQVAPDLVMTLTVQPKGPNGPTGTPSSPIEGDAVVAEAPSEVTFVFDQTGGRITAVAPMKLTAYGATVSMQWAQAAPAYEPALSQIFVRCAPQSPTFQVAAARSELFQPRGLAPVFEGAWALPVAVTDPARLGAASTPGLLALLVGGGLSATWEGMTDGPAPLAAALLEATGGALWVMAELTVPASHRSGIRLWSNAPSAGNSSVELSFRNGAILHFASMGDFNGATATEIVTCPAMISAHIDRPVAANGNRLGPDLPGVVSVFTSPLQNGVVIIGTPAPATASPPPMALALHNALIVTTPPLLLIIAGTFETTPAELGSGALLLGFGLETLLPFLPDPYAANYLPLTGERGVAGASALLAVVRWSLNSATTLTLSDLTLELLNLRLRVLPRSSLPATPGDAGSEDTKWLDALDGLFTGQVGSPAPNLLLLDVSGNVDQLGVGVTAAGTRAVGGGGSGLAIENLDLVAPAQRLRVMTPPAVQWEPVVTVQNPNVLPSPFPSPAGFLDDGGPTQIAVNDVTLVPVAPGPLFEQVIGAYASGKQGAVRFTLPFGMAAVAALPRVRATPSPLPSRPGLTRVQPAFTPQGMVGGRQLALTAPMLPPIHPGSGSPSLPGATVQLRNLVDGSGNPLIDPRPGGVALSILGPAVDEVFNSEFAPGGKRASVPVTRIDLSGYGASMFSAWTDPNAVLPAVVQARFNVMLGRASHEVVQVASVLHPWQAIVVRTITIDRQDDTEICRYDSGWVAATPGTFGLPGITVHPGAVIGAFNIREIKDTTQTYSPAPGVELVGAYFDADIRIEGMVSDGSGGLAPSTGQFGYIQTAPAGTPLTPAQLANLIDANGSLGGPVDCVIAVGGTAQTMRVIRVEVGNAPHAGVPETHEFAAAARGSLTLPQPGSWSVVACADNAGEPTPVDPDRGVPLIRQGPAGAPAATTPWRIAEPADLWTPAAPTVDYGLLHATDSTRVLFPRPVIENGAAAFTSDRIPLLADGFGLMGATSICPRQDTCLQFPNNAYALQIGGDGAFSLVNVPASFAPSLPERTLATGSAGTIALEYADEHGTPGSISVAIAPDAWDVAVRGANVRLDVTPFDALMRTPGDFEASSTSGASMQKGRLVLGSVLSPLQAFFEFLEMLGLPDPLDLAFSNDGWTGSKHYKLKADLQFSLPSPLLPALTPLLQTPTWKIGLSVKTGFGNTASSGSDLLTASAQWSFQFSLGGNVQWAVFPPIFAGGLIGLGIGVDFPAGTQPQTEQMSFQLGVIASVGGDIVPGVLKLQGSVSFAFMLVIRLSPSTSVAVGCGLTISVTGSILKGLVAITFAASATGMVTVTTPKSVQATFDVSVDVTICWFLDVSFDVSFQYTQSLN